MMSNEKGNGLLLKKTQIRSHALHPMQNSATSTYSRLRKMMLHCSSSPIDLHTTTKYKTYV